MPFAHEIFYFKMGGFVSIAQMFILTEQQADTVLPSPAKGWLKELVSIEAGMADVMRPSGVRLKEMPYEAFICSSEDLSASAASLSAVELADYAVRLQHIEDGYEEGPSEELQQELSRMIASKTRGLKRGHAEGEPHLSVKTKRRKVIYPTKASSKIAPPAGHTGAGSPDHEMVPVAAAFVRNPLCHSSCTRVHEFIATNFGETDYY